MKVVEDLLQQIACSTN